MFQIGYIGPGGLEFLLIMLVLLVLFGAKDAPKMMRKLNDIVDQIRRSANDFKRDVMYSDLHESNPPDSPDPYSELQDLDEAEIEVEQDDSSEETPVPDNEEESLVQEDDENHAR